MVSRDVRQVARIQRSERMQKLLQLLAGQVAGILNISRLSIDLGLDTATVRSYLSILETIFVVKRLPAYAPSQLARATAAPKITFVDSGLATHLGGGLTTGSIAGNQLENFVLSEIGRQLTWCEPVVQLFHYRDRDQQEVDAVLEDLSGRVVPGRICSLLRSRPAQLRRRSRLPFISALWTTSP